MLPRILFSNFVLALVCLVGSFRSSFAFKSGPHTFPSFLHCLPAAATSKCQLAAHLPHHNNRVLVRRPPTFIKATKPDSSVIISTVKVEDATSICAENPSNSIFSATSMDEDNNNEGTTAVEDLDTVNLNEALDDEAEQQQQQQRAKTIMLSLIWTVAALSALDRVAMSVALVPMSEEFGFTDTIKGSISSLFSVGYGLCIVPAGLIVANASPRIIMACGVTIWSLATIITPTTAPLVAAAASATMVPLLLARALVGSAESVVMPTIQRLLAAWTRPEEKSVIMAIIFSGFQSGTIAAYLLSPAIMDYFDGDWRELFYVYGAFGVVLLAPWLLFAKDSPKALLPQAADTTSIIFGNASEGKNDDVVATMALASMKVTNISASTSQQQSTTSGTSTWETSARIFRDAPWRDFAKSPGVWAMLLAHCSKNWGLYNTLAWTPTFYAEQYGIGVRDSAWLSVLPSVSAAACGLVAGNLADALIRYYSNRGEMNELTLTNVRKLFQSVALFGPALALGIMAMDIPADPVVAQCFLMVAVGLQAFTASGFESANQEKAGEKWAGLLYSVTSLPAVMVGTAGVYTVGQILDATGQDWSVVFGINAIVNILGGTAFLALYNSKREFD